MFPLNFNLTSFITRLRFKCTRYRVNTLPSNYAAHKLIWFYVVRGLLSCCIKKINFFNDVKLANVQVYYRNMTRIKRYTEELTISFLLHFHHKKSTKPAQCSTLYLTGCTTVTIQHSRFLAYWLSNK